MTASDLAPYVTRDDLAADAQQRFGAATDESLREALRPHQEQRYREQYDAATAGSAVPWVAAHYRAQFDQATQRSPEDVVAATIREQRPATATPSASAPARVDEQGFPVGAAETTRALGGQTTVPSPDIAQAPPSAQPVDTSAAQAQLTGSLPGEVVQRVPLRAAQEYGAMAVGAAGRLAANPSITALTGEVQTPQEMAGRSFPQIAAEQARRGAGATARTLADLGTLFPTPGWQVPQAEYAALQATAEEAIRAGTLPETVPLPGVGDVPTAPVVAMGAQLLGHPVLRAAEAVGERVAPAVQRLGEYGTELARASGLGPELGVIKRDLAAALPGPVRLPTDPAALRLLQGQRDIRLTADGLEVDLRRYQKSVQVGTAAPYVFYSPKSVAPDKYRTFSPYAGEGGSLGVQGTTVFQRPFVVEAFGEGTGVGAAVVEKLLPDGAARAAELGRAARGAANDPYSPSFAMAAVLREWGGYSQADSYAVAQQIITNYDSGVPRRFALMDAVGARLARAAGYDGVLYGRRGRIEEVMELREATYPGQRYRSTIRAEYQTGEQATAPRMSVADREAALTAVEQRLDALNAQIAQRHAEGVPAEFPPYGGQYAPDSWAAARHAEWQDLKGQVRALEEQRLRLRTTPAAATQPESTTALSGQPGGIVAAPLAGRLGEYGTEVARESGLGPEVGAAAGGSVARFYQGTGPGAQRVGVYPVAGDRVDGLVVRGHVPNTESIAATLGGEYQVLPGLREVALDYFEAPPEVTARTKALAAQIGESGAINPLIVAIDAEGPYILEGGHRYDALKILGAKSFPALVVAEPTARVAPAAGDLPAASGIVAAPAADTSFPSLLRAPAGTPEVTGTDLAAGRLGAVAGGVTGYQSADEQASLQERAGRAAMGALLGGAGTVGAVRGARLLTEAVPGLTGTAAGAESGILPALLGGGRGGRAGPPRLPGPPGAGGAPAPAAGAGAPGEPVRALGGQVGDPEALRRFQALDHPAKGPRAGVGEWLTRVREATQDEFVRLTQLERYRPPAAPGESAVTTTGAPLALRPALTTPGTPAAATVQEVFAQSRQLEDGLVSRWSTVAEQARPPALPPPTTPQVAPLVPTGAAETARATIREVPPSGPARLPGDTPALPPESPPVVVAAERESSHNLALRFAGVRGQADVILMTELRPLLRATIAEGNTVEDLNTLLRIRQVAELTRRGFATPGGMTTQDAEGAALALRARLGPERFAALVQRSNDLYAWQDRVLLEPARGSLLSGEQIDRFRAANEHYYPHIVMDVSDIAFDAVPVGQAVDLERGGVAQSGYYRRLGSERATVPPLEAMVQRVYTRLARLEKNRVAQAIVADLQDVDPSLAVLKREGQVARTGQGELSLLREGVKETYLVPTEVAQTAQHLDRQQANILVRAMGAVNAVSRAGFTALNPNFAVRNAIRDPLEAFYREGLAPFGYHHVKGLLSALVQDADWEAYLRSRAGIGGLFEGGAPAETVSRLAASPTQRFVQTVSNPLELIRKANEVLEQGTRIGVFTQKSGQVHGPALPGPLAGLIGGPTTATVGEAAVKSRQSTVDFGNGGYLTKALNPIILFANANAQGFYNVVEPLLQRSPAERLRAAARLAILGTAAAAAFSYNRLWHYSDGRSVYDDVPLYDRDHNIVLLYGIGRDTQGREVPAYFKPPKPQVVKGTWNLIEEGLRWAEGKSQRGLGELMRAMVDWTSPIPTAEGVIPPALKTPLEIAQNRDWFRQRELESERERRVPAGQRLRPTTSPAAVLAARGLEQLPLLKELSPIQLQHLLEGMAGGGGRVGLQGLAAALGAAGLTPEGTGGPPLVPPSTEVAASRLPVAAGVLGAQGGQLAQEERDRLEQQRQTVTAQAFRSLLRTEAYQRAPAAVQQQVRERVAGQIDARFANARRAITVPPARP